MVEKRIDLGGMTIMRKTFLLGMIRGHWDLERRAHDVAVADEGEETERLNTGIAMVTPIQDVLRVINSEEMSKIIKAAEDDYAKRFKETVD